MMVLTPRGMVNATEIPKLLKKKKMKDREKKLSIFKNAGFGL